jgi:flagellar basal-body rod modification protein FlgD
MNIQGQFVHSPTLAAAQSASTSSSGSTSSTSTQNANSAEQTFMQLLATELQSQDPTSPMDPTAMVGQMFSMNQLQQLIDINQTLSSALGGTPSSSGSGAMAASSAMQATLPSNVANAYLQQSPTGVN